MSPKISINSKNPLTQEWVNERRSFLKLMITITAGVLASCLPDINIEDNLAPPTTVPETTEYPTEIPSIVSTEAPAPTEYPTQAPTAASTEAPPATEIVEALPDYSCGPATGGAYIITGLCLRDRACIDVCPVEAIVPGFPINEWPSVYIDQDTCISCGACVPECPYGAIFPTEEVPSQYVAGGGEYINRPGLQGHYEGTNHLGNPVVLDSVYQLKPGQLVDLTQDIGCNNAFFTSGPGYSARDQDNGM